MDPIYHGLFPALWLGWAGYWWLLSGDVKASVRREPVLSRLLHVVPLVLAGCLLAAPRVPATLLNARLLPWSPWLFWTGAAVTAVGLAFTVWARRHLGRNWSGIVTLKQGHEFITSGPYAIVRHPIYSGLLLAVVGSALARGEWRGVLAVVIVALALWRKLRLEERWLGEQFAQPYAAYRRRVGALLPKARIWRSSDEG
jgi:protein-S-isoprenylcysteine O-methyltransferase Ste14